MPTVDITEYDRLAEDQYGKTVLTGLEPARGTQQVAITSGSLQSASFADNTRFIRVHTDGSIRLAFGVSPTASATSQRMVANSTEFFGVQPGTKVAIIQST